ncbi:MAG: peptidylprolyl isomerase [Puniceicoccales bacterium]
MTERYEKAPSASARHILVPTEEACEDLKKEIEGGASFADMAKKHSKCPSGQRGGDLGTFGRGQMVPEFDKVVFTGDLGKVHGPIKTDFGYHLIEITERT